MNFQLDQITNYLNYSTQWFMEYSFLSLEISILIVILTFIIIYYQKYINITKTDSIYSSGIFNYCDNNNSFRQFSNSSNIISSVVHSNLSLPPSVSPPNLLKNSASSNNKQILKVGSEASGLYSIVNGNGITGNIGEVGDDFNFQVSSYHRDGKKKKSGGDLVKVEIKGCDFQNQEDEVAIKIVDRLNGTHLVSYHVSRSGCYQISVYVNHVLVQGSPFKVTVQPQKYQMTINDHSDNQQHVIQAGEEITCIISPKRFAIHEVLDKIDLQVFFKENNLLKKLNNNEIQIISNSNNNNNNDNENDQVDLNDPFQQNNNLYNNIRNSFNSINQTAIKIKLVKSGEYVIQGTVTSIPILNQSIQVVSGPVSCKYSHLLWNGKELISENKLFILSDQSTGSGAAEEEDNFNNLAKFQIKTKDIFGNVSKSSKISDFKFYLCRSLAPVTSKKSTATPLHQDNSISLDSINRKNTTSTSDFTPSSENLQVEDKSEHEDEEGEEIQPKLLVQDDENSLITFTIPIRQEGFHYIIVKYNGYHITNSPYSLISIHNNNFQTLTNYLSANKATFPCQMERNQKLVDTYLTITPQKLVISEYCYLINFNLYELVVNPTVQIILEEKKNEILIRDNKSQLSLKNCTNNFLLYLTSFYFFGFQTEPSFELKIQWMKTKLKSELSQIGGGSRSGGSGQSVDANGNYMNKIVPLKIQITSRSELVEQSIQILKSIEGKDIIASRLIVKYNEEEGIDIGGISKEWFSKFSEEIGIWKSNGIPLFDQYPHNRFHPSPFSNMIPNYKTIFNTFGKITAKSILDSVLKADRHLSIHFTCAFYKLLLGEQLSIHNVEHIDPDFYRNRIQFILENPMDKVNEILCEPLYFTRTIHNENPEAEIKTKTLSLKPFGNLIKVTDENKLEYLNLLVKNIYYQSVKIQMDEFREGFFQVIPPHLISIFHWSELEVLISGRELINLDDLRMNSIFTGLYNQEAVETFWKILMEFSDQEKKSLLKFVTGSSSVPLGGFYQLCPHFTINITPTPLNNNNRLPISHTCFNRLDISKNCLDYKTLKSNLLLSITEGSEGFSLI
ncbi:ubiquitin-protein ligase domain-containing protein [Tieghemostelium lacteum]|uniref:HECT-type E3 ubiquitin transferase n=1 Tax=Tieghemostelium lacteum TaxID=361077 RepID=A0A151Z7R5_TIELA|nr:ubiquitin-protein ligase domain-containing protein [Tieghemostelium lacteum]|eukprot:KYQ89975.1 ubiquitin-protein ligase domain-containing protein [Tieghemostelium lacteum]